MKKSCSKYQVFFILVLLFIIAGCVSSQQAAVNSTPPDWVTSAPKESVKAMFFVGSATDDAGDMSRAEEIATGSLIAEITRYLGVRVTEETTSTAKASLDAFTTGLTQTIKQSSTAQVAGFRIADRWVSKKNDRVMVYLLGEYNKQDLLSEKDRLAAVFREKQEAVSRPEQEAGEYASEGRYFDALKKYFEAAAAAYKSDIDNAKVKFERNLNSARTIISNFSLNVVTDNLQNMVGVPFTDSLKARVVYGTSGTPVANASFEISYKEMKNGRANMKTVTTLSDEKGFFMFTPPVAATVGTEKVTARLDLSSYLEPLSDVPADLKSQISALEDLIGSKRAVFSYVSVSRAKDVPTGLVILDVDKAQNPLKNGETASGILQSLTNAGFNVTVLPVDPSLLRGMSDAQILEMVQKSGSVGLERLIFGVVGIDDFSQDGDSYLVKVSGSIKTADLTNGKIVFSAQDFARTVGKNSNSTITSAFRNLGKKLGEELASKLP